MAEALIREFDAQNQEWLGYEYVVAKLCPIVPPAQAIREAEYHRVKSHEHNTGGVVKERTRNKTVTEQIMVGQSSIIRNRLKNLAQTGHIDIIKDGARYDRVRLTEKGKKYDQDIDPKPPKKVLAGEAPVATYQVEMKLNLTDEMKQDGSSSVVSELNLKAIQETLDRQFPGLITVTLISKPEDTINPALSAVKERVWS